MKKQLFVLTLGVSLLGFSATAQHAEHSDHPKSSTTTQAKAPAAFGEQLANVYQASLALKEAFVASDAAKVKGAVPAVKKVLAKVDMKLLKGQAHNDWMSQVKTLNASLDKIVSGSNIETQREQFAAFSQALYQSMKAHGAGDVTVYYQHCPMALNNKGAYWLSDTKQIRNPYFGDKMLKCGSTKEVL